MGKLAIVLSAFRSASQHGEVDDDDKKKAPLKYLIHSAKGSWWFRMLVHVDNCYSYTAAVFNAIVRLALNHVPATFDALLPIEMKPGKR